MWYLAKDLVRNRYGIKKYNSVYALVGFLCVCVLTLIWTYTDKSLLGGANILLGLLIHFFAQNILFHYSLCHWKAMIYVYGSSCVSPLLFSYAKKKKKKKKKRIHSLIQVLGKISR